MRLEDSLRNQADSRFLVSDQLVLDRSDRRAWMDSGRLDLGSKALSLLEELMQHPQMLVTKDRLFDVGWPDQAVSDAVLTTAIRELRRALGDPARKPEWIETHHGKGYRFLRPVDARAIHPGRRDERKRKSLPTPAAAKRYWLAFAGALGVLLAIGWFVSKPVSSIDQTQGMADSDVRGVAVLPFEVEGGEDWVGSAMSSRLTSVLRKAPRMFVADNRLVAAMSESEDPWNVARADRIGAIVTGKVLIADNEIRVDVEILDTAGRAIWSRRLHDSEDEVINLTERVAIETARALKVATDPRQTAEMARVGTQSIAAFEQYSRAAQILDSLEAFRNAERISEALDHLRKAVAIDPTFAKAASSLSWFEFPRAYQDNAGPAEAKALALENIAIENAVDEFDRDLGRAALALRQLRFGEARRELERLYSQSRETSSDTNHSILLQLSYIAAAIRDREMAERVWRDLTNYNLARGRIQFSTPHLIAHSKTLLLRYVDNLSQQGETAQGVYNRHTALLLAGESARAQAELNSDILSDSSPLKTLMRIGQACAEGRTDEARKLARSALGASPDPTRVNWTTAQIAGLTIEIDKLRPPAPDEASQRALLTMMGDPGFDPRHYPLLSIALSKAGVNPTPVPRATFYCPVN